MTTKDKQSFYDKYYPVIVKATEGTGIHPEVAMAQMIQETGWGTSKGFTEDNAGFGIKPGKDYKGTTKNRNTFEEDIDGNATELKADFRSYNSIDDSVNDYVDFLSSKDRYSDAISKDTPEEQIKALKDAGYATDDNYVSSVTSLMDDGSDYMEKSMMSNPDRIVSDLSKEEQNTYNQAVIGYANAGKNNEEAQALALYSMDKLKNPETPTEYKSDYDPTNRSDYPQIRDTIDKVEAKTNILNDETKKIIPKSKKVDNVQQPTVDSDLSDKYKRFIKLGILDKNGLLADGMTQEKINSILANDKSFKTDKEEFNIADLLVNNDSDAPYAEELPIEKENEILPDRSSKAAIANTTINNKNTKSFDPQNIDLDGYTGGDRSAIGGESGVPEMTGAGNMVGAVSGAVGNLANLATTIASRDQIKDNPFANYASDALSKLASMKSMAGSMRDMQMQDATLSKNTARANNRNMARGVGDMRALDMGTHVAGLKNQRAINSAYENQIMNISGQEAGMLLDRDKTIMSGQERTDAINQANKDNYLSNLSSNITDFSTTGQQLGKTMNQQESNKLGAYYGSQGKYGDYSSYFLPSNYR